MATESSVYRCRGRGNFRKRNIKPLVGDRVDFADGYLLDVLPRKNQLLRPPLANIDQALLVMSAVQPAFQTLLLDRFLVRFEADDIPVCILVSKTDLVEDAGRKEIEEAMAAYRRIGYDVIALSTLTGEGTEDVGSLLEERISVLAGQSGVGKSSLLNGLDPALALEIGEMSAHLGRGKHTTRRVGLMPFRTGMIADTPGFSSLDFRNIMPEQLSDDFPEMKVRRDECKFRQCKHIHEPGCAVKSAVETGEIRTFRYKHYEQFLAEIQQNQRRRY